MRVWFRFWRRRQVSIKRDLKKSRLFSVMGHKIFSNSLWKIDKHTIADGLSLGFFIAFMPTIGLQMILVALGAVIFKVNLPVALAACWVTNPLTAIPIYTAAWGLGKFMLADITFIKDIFDLYLIEGRALKVMLNGLYLWTGSLVFSLSSAVIVNILARTLWPIAEKLQKFQDKKRDLKP